MPETYALIENNGDVKRFLELSGNRPEFVIKPAAGSAGRGIIVVARHDGREFFTSSGQRYTHADLCYRIAGLQRFGIIGLNPLTSGAPRNSMGFVASGIQSGD